MSFGKTLAALREAAGLTQVQVAQRAGVGIDTYRRWEQERHLPKIDDAYRLAKALGVPIEELILPEDMESVLASEEEEQPEPPPEAKPRGRKKKEGK
jgi:transcriptional regulator with XRE-family HTH domain